MRSALVFWNSLLSYGRITHYYGYHSRTQSANIVAPTSSTATSVFYRITSAYTSYLTSIPIAIVRLPREFVRSHVEAKIKVLVVVWLHDRSLCRGFGWQGKERTDVEGSKKEFRFEVFVDFFRKKKGRDAKKRQIKL
jgi:hypothetical protein